jgi:hypothetical protein
VKLSSWYVPCEPNRPVKDRALLPVWIAFVFIVFLGRSSAADTPSLTLAWDPAQDGGVTGYVLSYGTAPGTYSRDIDVGLTTQFTVGDLAAGTTYYFAVRAYDAAGGLSPRSEEVFATTPAPTPTPPPPPPVWDTTPDAFAFTALTRVSPGAVVTSNPITVSGINRAAPIAITGGQFSVSGGAFTSGPATVTNGQTVVVRVNSASDYATAVRARVTIGGVSGDFRVMTEPPRGRKSARPGLPKPPRSVVPTVRDDRVIELGWDPSEGDAAGYRVEVGSARGLADVSSFTTGVTSRFALRDLAPGTYYLRVRGVTAAGAGEASKEVVVTIAGPVPGAPGMPADFHYQVQGTTVRFRWTPPVDGGRATRYVIEATDIDGSPLATIDTGNASTLMLHDAAGPGVYVARVRAANSSGLGPPSLPITVVIPK